MASDQHPFGVFGMALALVRSFTGDGAAILLDAGAGPTLADEYDWLGCWTRGSEPTCLDFVGTLIDGSGTTLPDNTSNC